MSKILEMWRGMTGTVLPFAGATAPDGWLLCYGQSLLREDYPALFAVIGTTYGAADGTHFNVPDLRGRVAAGKDDMGGTAANRLGVTLSGTRASAANGVISGLSSTAGLSIGMKATGTGIGASAVISSIDSSTQVTLSVNNSATGTADIRFSVVDGATLGDVGGAQAHQLVTAQMPAHTHGVSANGAAGSAAVLADLAGDGNVLTTTSQGGGQAHPNLQPTLVLNSIIKT